MIIKCARTGIEFETDSNRQKNHPEISAVLAEASKDKQNAGAYRAAAKACEAIKADGTYTIGEAVEFIRQAVTEGSVPQQARTRGTAMRQRKEQRRSREQINAILRQHGYTWSKEDEESMDVFGATAFECTYGAGLSAVWTLAAPDGREVTVQQALAEIEAK